MGHDFIRHELRAGRSALPGDGLHTDLIFTLNHLGPTTTLFLEPVSADI